MHLVTKLSITVNDPSLPVIADSDLNPLVPYEVDAIEHWMFGGDSGSLIGLKNGSVLSPQASGQTYNASSIVIPAWGAALISTVTDNPRRTVWSVLKKKAQSATTDGSVLFGTFTQTAGDGGSGIYLNSTGNSLTAINRSGTNKPVNWPSGTAVDDWLFVAMVEQLGSSDGTKQYKVFIGSSSSVQAETSARPAVARTLALGNAYYDNANFKTVPLEVAEFGVFPGPLDDEAMAGLYARSKMRMHGRGITVK